MKEKYESPEVIMLSDGSGKIEPRSVVVGPFFMIAGVFLFTVAAVTSVGGIYTAAAVIEGAAALNVYATVTQFTSVAK